MNLENRPHISEALTVLVDALFAMEFGKSANEG